MSEMSEVNVKGGGVVYEEVKVQREIDGTRMHQQPQRQKDPQKPRL